MIVMEKILVPIIILITVIVIAVGLFFVLTKPLNGATTPGGYPTSMCKCEGSEVLGRCYGELKDCLYLD